MPPPLSSFFKILRPVAILAAAGFVAASAGAQPSATASFTPSQIAVGETGQYQLELRNFQNPSGTVPLISGLKMQSSGTQTKMEFNGSSISSTVTYLYQVEADQPGTYTMPAYNLQSDGKNIPVPSATLVVTAQPVAPASSANSPATTVTNTGQPITLTAKVARTQVFVGEKIPLDLVIAARDDALLTSVNGFNQIGDAFEQVQSNLHDEPAKDTVQQDGHSFDIYTWHTATTPITAGPQTVRFTMPVSVRVNDGNAGDDVMSQMLSRFGMGGQEKQLTLESPPLNFDVQPLPADGRPANFTDGIGLFSVEDPTLSSTDLQVGVPVTLTLTVSGAGNFDRLKAPALDTGALWRSYTPKQTFQASDSTGIHGTKTFEYVLMPLSENITEVPAPQFNFFNPETKTYVDLTPKPIPVTVKPAPPGQNVPLPAVTNTVAAVAAPTLVGPRTEPGSWVNPSLKPVFFSPYFLGAQALPAVILATLVITRRRQLRLETDPAYARKIRSRRAALAALDQARAAASAGHAAEFYAGAQRALQQAASASSEWRQENSAQALTWAEFDAHLSARGLPAETHAAVREIFEAGDALRFGGFTPSQETLAQAAVRLDGLVRELLRHA